MINRLEAAYSLGIRYKAIGMMKVCPLYEDLVAEQYFFAGYDGRPISEVGVEKVQQDARDAG